MMSSRLKIVNWAARAPGRETRAQWCSWAAGSRERTETPPGAELPMMLRRRLTPAGQAAVAVANEAGATAEARYVFCSRHGEFSRTIRLLKSVAESEPLSPADFSVSVHNALAGILSIASRSHEGHTAIANGSDSFAAGMMEAIGLLAAIPEVPVLLVYFDSDLPSPYDEVEPPDGEAALAVAALLSARSDAGTAVKVRIEQARGAVPNSTTHQALGFIRFLASGETERSTAGSTFDLRWTRAD